MCNYNIENFFISIVIPCLNEESNIAAISNKIINILYKNGDNKYEVWFVDDGSTDNTFDEIKKINNENKNIKAISLSRNFGHQIALMAGLQQCKGDVIIMMDADLQHPPELIPQMLALFKQGYDIVNTQRIDDRNTVKNIFSKIFYKIFNYLSDVPVQKASSDFRLLSRRAADALLQMPEQERFTRGLVSWIGFKQTVIPYKAPVRQFGKSKYSWGKQQRLAWAGLTAFTAKPLFFAFYIGLFIFACGIGYGIYAFIAYLNGHTQPGWLSILLTIIILGGLQLLFIGIIGQYLAHIYTETKQRPLFFIEKKLE